MTLSDAEMRKFDFVRLMIPVTQINPFAIDLYEMQIPDSGETFRPKLTSPVRPRGRPRGN